MSYPLPRSHSVWLQITVSVLLLASCKGLIPDLQQAVATITAFPPLTEPASELSQIEARIPLPQGAGAVAFSDGSIWVTNTLEHNVSRVDIQTGKAATTPISLDFEPKEIAYGAGAVWVCSVDRSRLARIDPQINQVVVEIDLSALQIPAFNFVTIAAGEGAVWITDEMNVIQIDPHTNQIVGKPLPAGEEIITVALGHGTLWTGSHDDGIISRVDARTHSVVATIETGFSIHGLAVSEDSAWVLDEHGFGVVRIDPQSNQLQERVPIDFIGSNLAAGAGSVWVAPAARDSGQATGNDGIARIQEAKKETVETIHVGDAPTSEYYAVYFSEGFVWVLVNTPQASLVKIKP
jgi:streptogramin lyase